MIRRNVKYTVREYTHLPEDERYELIDGELYPRSSHTASHQRVLGNLLMALD